ncbi:hypothetical protein K7432_017780 [Basidiobolus ranarum]|uniref:Extracellular membrane protein CFEM domain-containing protein n=1 Tax=Basidiobolus ranarum TaxID=34480 RepID=A0ABR2WCY3_9FUNG
MKSIFIIALATFSLVAAQEDSHEVQGCLSQCDQDSTQWVACAAECVGVSHPIIQDVQETKECVNECDNGDDNCHNECIRAHFDRHNLQDGLVTRPPFEDTFEEHSASTTTMPTIQNPESAIAPKINPNNGQFNQPNDGNDQARADRSSNTDIGMAMPSLPSNGQKFDHPNQPTFPDNGGNFGGVHTTNGLGVVTPTPTAATGPFATPLAGRIQNKGVAANGTPSSSAFGGISRSSPRTISTSILPSSKSTKISISVIMVGMGALCNIWYQQ